MEKIVLKTMLKKQIIQDSFYGVLGILPNATMDEIKNSFENKLKNDLTVEELKSLLKAYGILSSSYKKQYDEYISKMYEGIKILLDKIDNESDLIDLLKNSVENNNILPEGVYMQPWATTI